MSEAREHTGPSRASKSSDFAERLLRIFECIAVNGPISLFSISELTSIPKVSVWRACQALKSKGWIRVRLSDQSLELSSFFDSLLAKAHISLEEMSEVSTIISSINISRELHFSVGMFVAPGKFVILDGSRRRTSELSELSLAFDNMPTAALLGCTRLEIMRHLEVYCRTANKDERQYILSGEKFIDTCDLARDIIVWRHDVLGYSFPYRFLTGAVGAVEVMTKSTKASGLKSLKMSANFMRAWAEENSRVSQIVLSEPTTLYAEISRDFKTEVKSFPRLLRS